MQPIENARELGIVMFALGFTHVANAGFSFREGVAGDSVQYYSGYPSHILFETAHWFRAQASRANATVKFETCPTEPRVLGYIPVTSVTFTRHATD